MVKEAATIAKALTWLNSDQGKMFKRFLEGAVKDGKSKDGQVIGSVLKTFGAKNITSKDIQDFSETAMQMETVPDVTLDDIKKTAVGNIGDYLADFAASAASRGSRAIGNFQQDKYNRLAAALLARADRRAASPYNTGMLEDKYTKQAQNLMHKGTAWKEGAEALSGVVDDTYGSYARNRDLAKSQQLARMNPQSAGYYMAESARERRADERARRMTDRSNKGSK